MRPSCNTPVLWAGYFVTTWRAAGVGIAIVGLTAFVAHAQLVINEILLNPPGSDTPHEYIELRGTPNLVLPAGTHLIAVEGDAGGNPGTIQNAFDLSGRTVGGNGFLVLLQKTSSYAPNANATVMVNTGSGAGWGSGATSSIGHRGEGGQTEIENPSVTFFLVQSASPINVGDDIDSDSNGTPDGSVFASWTVLDSVGVLDADGAGDFGYGAINFRRNTSPGNGATASGVIVPVSFTPSYVGRASNTVGSAASAWVASDNLGGVAPDWTLGLTTNTAPVGFAGAALNHLGAPNFGAPAIPGVVLGQSGSSTEVSEVGGVDSYTLALNTAPTSAVTIQITCGPQLEVSTNGGATFGPMATLTFTNTIPKIVTVRALEDNIVEASPRRRFITNTVSSTSDATQYPLSTIVPSVPVSILDNDIALLTELKVNPPGTNDAPHEFIEIKGPVGALLTNVYLLGLDGNTSGDPGTVSYAFNLTGKNLGANGLLAVVATNHPYALAPGTTVITDPQLSGPGGALDNGTISFLLVGSAVAINPGQDLDNGDNGILEGLASDATIMDAVGWSDGGNNDIIYGGVELHQAGTPDAATRFPGNNTPNLEAAWFCGDLAGSTGDSLAYDPGQVSDNFPDDTVLTPGALNNTAPSFSGVVPISGVLGDPTNPTITFTVSDAETMASAIAVTATSSNSAVVPDVNLLVTAGAGGTRTLALNPVGVGYSFITLLASDGSMTGRVTFPYAASAMGRPGGVWHLGASDGSTALAVDADFMFVGDDENQTIRLYHRNESSLPLSQFNMTAFLELPDVEDGQVREVDIEATTRVGNRLFWMGSHSHANIGETRTNRTRIWATDLAGTGAASALTYVGRYDNLKVDLINWDKSNGHGKGSNYFGLEASDAEGVQPKAPDGSGFSIEGLAMMPGSTNGAFVAFRAPIIPATNRNYALIVPVLNFTTLAVSNGPPGSAVFGAPIELDLYGRGIRSLEGNSNGYLIVAGPAGANPGNYPQDFRLYTWTGNPADQPQQRAADLSDLNPEGISELPPTPWTSATQFQILSDNGQSVFYGDGIPAKSLPVVNFKKCRSDLVALGAVVKPAPIITTTRLSGTNLTVSWRALQGETYRVQSKSDLAQASWSDVAGDVTATGPYASKVVSSAGPQLFCRVVLLP
jgi:hypothetical protein